VPITVVKPSTAVAGVDLDLRSGEVLGLVGESGSGKSVTLRAVLGLVRPPGRVGGQVLWQGRDLMALPEAAYRSRPCFTPISDNSASEPSASMVCG